MPDSSDLEAPSRARSVRVWDLPVRVFHWALAALIVLSFVTAQVGGNAMAVHELSGYSVLTLALFRIVWGFLGSTHARFSSFVRGPAAVGVYARSLRAGKSTFHLGHNPLGGWMIVALLASLITQTATGLFSNDDVMLEGPLARLVSKDTSDLLTKLHHINFYVLASLILLHISAALYYLYRKRENLVLPLITGRKRVPAGAQAKDASGGTVWLAAAVLAVCAAAVWLIVR